MSNYNILPTPKHMSFSNESMTLAPQYYCEHDEFLPAIAVFSSYCDRLLARFLSPGDAGLTVRYNPRLPSEAYRITCDNALTLEAADVPGINHAFATLIQLASPVDEGICVPRCVIEDAPDNTWRCLLVDVARKWHPLPWLLRYIDMCWLYKLDRLQLHFTDFNSYTLPSAAFPLLPSVNRAYTKSELTLLQEYASIRGIMLVPEVEMPGHCGMFLRAYPDIFGRERIICAEEKTFKALETVLSEVMEIFPGSKYIHFGGDEANIEAWDDCEGCRAYRAANALPDVRALYAHFVGRISHIILKLGRSPVVWEGFPKEYNSEVPRETLVIAWDSNYQSAADLVESGFTLVNSSFDPMYIVTPRRMYEANAILDWNTRRWTQSAGDQTQPKRYIIVPDSARVVGGQLCAWGDYLVEYSSNEVAAAEEFANVRERISAASERMWSNSSDFDKVVFNDAAKAVDQIVGKIALDY